MPESGKHSGQGGYFCKSYVEEMPETQRGLRVKQADTTYPCIWSDYHLPETPVSIMLAGKYALSYLATLMGESQLYRQLSLEGLILT